jgi:hypothetical protein
MATDHAQTVKDIIDASAYAGTAYNAPWQSGKNDQADRGVSIVQTGLESPPDLFFSDSESEKRHRVQVRVRGEPNNAKQARQDALLLEDVLQNQSRSGYLAVRIVSGPLFLDQDEKDRYEYSINVLCWIIE